jgi:ADP-ribose pyrophosphatase YjhB (NUDIX family)
MKEKVQYVVPCALIKRGNKVLLTYKVKSSNPLTVNIWEIPGGRAPFGISFEQGLKEKIKEYLGVNIEITRIYPKIFSNVVEDEKCIKHYFVICAECKIIKGKIRLNKEKLAQYKWFTFEECKKLHQQGKLAPGDFEFIKIAFESIAV